MATGNGLTMKHWASDRLAQFSYWQILLQKSRNAERLIFRERTKQAAIADRCSLKRAAEVACEFVAGCSSPPHQYSIAAPTARKIFDRWCKKTFATWGNSGLRAILKLSESALQE
ncbi:hypothetical protein, partial [Bradyrhizobium sp. URHD0069]|uniref:hypothetical protein n=1 Tax=Bradyrhizobium sp. URHD0069 TaxID=1380355 RepID=UPI001AEC3978